MVFRVDGYSFHVAKTKNRRRIKGITKNGNINLSSRKFFILQIKTKAIFLEFEIVIKEMSTMNFKFTG